MEDDLGGIWEDNSGSFGVVLGNWEGKSGWEGELGVGNWEGESGV